MAHSFSNNIIAKDDFDDTSAQPDIFRPVIKYPDAPFMPLKVRARTAGNLKPRKLGSLPARTRRHHGVYPYCCISPENSELSWSMVSGRRCFRKFPGAT